MSSNAFFWNSESLADQTACATVHLSWSYIGDDIPMDISFTNIGVEQEPPSTGPTGTPTESTPTLTESTPSFPSFTNESNEGFMKRQEPAPPTSTQKDTQFLIIQGVSALARQYDWAKLTAPEGYYQFIAASQDQTINERSETIFVRNGTDLSCLAVVEPTSSSSSTLTPTGETSSPATTNTASPVLSGGTSHTKEIVGGVIGALAALALIACALFLFWRRKRAQQMGAMGSSHMDDGLGGVGSVHSSKSATKHKKGGKWGGLSSVDSIAASGTAERQSSKSLGRTQPNSPGTVAMMDRRGSHSAGTSPIYADEGDIEKVSPTSPLSSEEGGLYTFTPETLGYQYSSDTSHSSGHHGLLAPTTRSEPLYPSGVTNIMAEDILNYQSPTSTSPVGPPVTGLSPSPTPKHKMSRKPVPSYTPSTISGIGPTTIPQASPTPPPALPPLSSSPGHYAIGGGGRSPLNDGHEFGGRDGKVHYLIPDVPSAR